MSRVDGATRVLPPRRGPPLEETVQHRKGPHDEEGEPQHDACGTARVLDPCVDRDGGDHQAAPEPWHRGGLERFLEHIVGKVPGDVGPLIHPVVQQSRQQMASVAGNHPPEKPGHRRQVGLVELCGGHKPLAGIAAPLKGLLEVEQLSSEVAQQHG